jgi:hypothetical protein
MMPAGRRLIDSSAVVALPVFALILSAAPLMRTQPGVDVCSWLTPATLLGTLGHHFDPPEKQTLPAVHPGLPQGTKCHWPSSNDSLFSVEMVGYVDPSAAAARATFQEMAGYMAAAGKLDGNTAGSNISGIGEAAYIDEDSTLHVLKVRVRFTVDVQGFPNRQQRQRDVANLVLPVAAKQ